MRSVVAITALSGCVLVSAAALAARQTPPPAQTPPAQGQTPPAQQGPRGGATPPAPGSQRAAGAPQPAPANLKALPKDWTRAQVTTLMRTFTSALGVQCNYCHMGDTPATMNYAADGKKEKETARTMIHMVLHINQEHLKGIGAEAPPAAAPPAGGAPAAPAASLGSKVTCYTCHRGEKKPATIATPAPGKGGSTR